MVKLLVGNFTFLDPQIDGEHKAIINFVSGVVDCYTEDEACKLGEEMLNYYESYLVLPTYKGELEYDNSFKQLFENIEIDLDM